MCYEVISKELFTLKYCLNRYKTQEICDKVVDALLATLKFVSNYTVTNEILETLNNTVFSNDDIVFADADYDFAKFFSDDMGLNAINLNNIILEDDNFDEDDPETIIHVRLMACHNRST